VLGDSVGEPEPEGETSKGTTQQSDAIAASPGRNSDAGQDGDETVMEDDVEQFLQDERRWTVFEDEADEIKYLRRRGDVLAKGLLAARSELARLYEAGMTLQRKFEENLKDVREAKGEIAYWKALAQAAQEEHAVAKTAIAAAETNAALAEARLLKEAAMRRASSDKESREQSASKSSAEPPASSEYTPESTASSTVAKPHDGASLQQASWESSAMQKQHSTRSTSTCAEEEEAACEVQRSLSLSAISPGKKKQQQQQQQPVVIASPSKLRSHRSSPRLSAAVMDEAMERSIRPSQGGSCTPAAPQAKLLLAGKQSASPVKQCSKDGEDKPLGARTAPAAAESRRTSSAQGRSLGLGKPLRRELHGKPRVVASSVPKSPGRPATARANSASYNASSPNRMAQSPSKLSHRSPKVDIKEECLTQ